MQERVNEKAIYLTEQEQDALLKTVKAELEQTKKAINNYHLCQHSIIDSDIKELSTYYNTLYLVKQKLER